MKRKNNLSATSLAALLLSVTVWSHANAQGFEIVTAPDELNIEVPAASDSVACVDNEENNSCDINPSQPEGDRIEIGRQQSGRDDRERDPGRTGRTEPGRHHEPGRGRFEMITMTCNSNKYSYTRCEVNARVENVLLQRQLSRSSCREGHSFGFDSFGIWVDKGCRANFTVMISR